MDILINLDLLSVGIAVAGTAILGFVVYFNNKNSTTNKIFLFFSLITTVWGLTNYLSYQFNSGPTVLWLFRIVLFFAVWQAFFIYTFFKIFPDEKFKFSKKYKFVLVPIVSITSILTLTPLVFTKITGVVKAGEVAFVDKGQGLIIFGTVAVGLVFASFITLLKKIKRTPQNDRGALNIILTGALITFFLIMLFNFIIATFYNNPRFVPLGALFFFPFILFTSYSIIKHKIFNIKVITTSLLVFALTIVTFAEIIFAGKNLSLIIFRSSIFALVLMFGILLIKNVLKEVEQRERIQRLAEDLERANEAQTNLIHFITHQVKGFFTKSRNIFAGLKEGDYGQISSEAKDLVEEGFKSDTKAVETVQEILNAANLRKGTVEYKKEEFDLTQLIKEEFEKKKGEADKKGVSLEFIEAPQITFKGDKEQLAHAFRNLIDNSIKYTPSGSIKLSLNKEANKITFDIKDTGVGIDPDDKKRLFTEGGRGKDSVKVNVDSTGYGLYIVKQIIDGHGGKIWAESEGKDKGSTFKIELPA